MEFRILRIDSENKKIGLSARAADHDELHRGNEDLYDRSHKGGMASLGELADFFGSAKAKQTKRQTKGQ